MSSTSTYITCAILFIFFTFSKIDPGKTEAYYEDAKEIIPGRVYYWKNWCFCRDTKDLCIWSEAAVLKLWMESATGWFQFVIDDKSMTMYRKGRLVDEFNSAEFDLQKVKRMIKSANDTQPILSHAKSTKLFAGNWFLISRKEGELTIQHDTDGQQVITLQEDFPGFTSESYGKKLTFSANTSMGAVFSASWITGRKTNQLRPKAEAPKPKTEHQSNLTSCFTLLGNNSDSGLTEIRCHTKARLHNISYVWTIDRFDLHRPVDDSEKLLKSPLFSSATYDKSKWYLQIKPGNRTSDKISLFLIRSPNSTEPQALAQYSVNFIDRNGNLMHTLAQEWPYTFGKKTDAWGWYEIPINKVVSSDNTMNIVCRIAICEFTTDAFHLNRNDTIKHLETTFPLKIVKSQK